MAQVGIIGSGTMGTGIAQVVASAGNEVLLFDSNEQVLNQARDTLLTRLNRLAEKGQIDDLEAKAIFGRIYFIDDLDAFSNVELVIEAIIENLDIKKNLFADLEKIIPQDSLLSTNTSSLSVTSIASACKNPERVVGIHFFNPAPLMKLIEIVPALQTSESTTNTVKSFVKSWDKIPVIAKDTPGFIVNRVARPFYSEAIRILDEGIADIATIDWAVAEIGGFKMGPFTLMDLIGNDINYAVTESVFNSFYFEPRYQPSFTQKRLVEAGWLGRKTGKGFYDYREKSDQPLPKKDLDLGNEIFNRILLMLINEAADALYFGVASKEDLDIAMTTGVNYPKGLLRWADELGIEKAVAMMDELHHNYLEDRYRCSVLLRKMAKEGKTFY